MNDTPKHETTMAGSEQAHETEMTEEELAATLDRIIEDCFPEDAKFLNELNLSDRIGAVGRLLEEHGGDPGGIFAILNIKNRKNYERNDT